MSIVERYVHSRPKKDRKWDQGYLQYISVDPAKINFAFRIERRYDNGRIIPIVFWKQNFGSNIYQNIFKRLEEFSEEYLNTHIVLIEKQPPRNITINRIMQHVLTYFMTKMKDYPLLPEINEVDARLKGSELGANPDENLKKWSSKISRDLLVIREDNWSLEIMDYWRQNIHPKNERKDDDLADTIVMIEAYCKKKGYLETKSLLYQTLEYVRIIRSTKNFNKENSNKIQPKKIIVNRIVKKPSYNK